MNKDEKLKELTVWTLETLIEAGEGGMSNDELDRRAVAAGMVPPGVKFTWSLPFALIEAAFRDKGAALH